MSAYPSNSPVLDGYRLIRFLGRGGFGEVWLCQSEAMLDYRALKLISASNSELLEKEYESLLHYRNASARLRSPHLIPIEHVNRNDDALYYVMPLADGIATPDPVDPEWRPLSLGEKIRMQADMPAWFSSREIISIVLPILQGLQVLSDAGLVHRDVKPENILFFSGEPCLGDISLLGADASAITRRGTPGYATPSWYVGGLPDMYGVAALLYTLLTGNLPDKMGRSAFLWPPQGEESLPDSERLEWKRLHAVVRRATDEKVSERFIDFRSLAHALAPTGSAVVPGVKPWRVRVMVSGLALIVVAACAIVVANQRRHPTTSNQAAGQNGGKRPELPELTNDEKADYAALAGMIQGYMEDGKYELALTSVDNLLGTYPQARTQSSYSVARAMALHRLGRIDEAKEELRKEVNLSPNIAAASARASLWLDLGDPAAAEADLSRVLATFGPNTLILRQRSDIRIRRQDYAGVEEDRNAALAIRPEDPAQARAVELLWEPLEKQNPGYEAYLGSLRKSVPGAPVVPEADSQQSSPAAVSGESTTAEGDDGDAETPLAIARFEGRFSFLKGGLAGVVASAISVRDAPAVEHVDPFLVDIESEAKVGSIIQSFEKGNYARCLELLDQHVAANPALRAQTACTLLRALLLQQLHRDEEMNREIARIRENPADIRWSSDELAESDNPDSKAAATSDGSDSHSFQKSAAAVRTLMEVQPILVLWEAMGLYRQGEQFAARVLQSVLPRFKQFEPGELLDLYSQHARMKILLGDFDGALGDATRLMALPLDFTDPEDHLSPKLAERYRRNTVRAKWQGLEHAFPEFGDYVAKKTPW